MRRIGVLSSGGDTPGMNAAIRAVVKTATHLNMEVMGIEYGFRGLIQGRIRQLTPENVEKIIYKGGTILKTCRCPEFQTEEGQLQAVKVCEAFDIEGIVVIGGDGSMRGAGALSARGVNTVTLPGTIDNDLAYTDFTIGFDTAVNGVIEEMNKVNDTMVSHDRIGVVEVMGRNCGDIALYSAMAAGANFLMIPEAPFDLDQICAELVKRRLKGQFSSMIVVAEGAASASDVAAYIREKTGYDTKATVLGHTQRGGNPSQSDRILASRLAEAAVRLLYKGVSNRVVGLRSNQVVDMDIEEALKCKKELDVNIYKLCQILAE
ncbi:MAG: 6-phosphofructokinase [Clostridiales bacterium]|nr:6-phosphofructokinase [Clostridiales bacterium]